MIRSPHRVASLMSVASNNLRLFPQDGLPTLAAAEAILVESLDMDSDSPTAPENDVLDPTEVAATALPAAPTVVTAQPPHADVQADIGDPLPDDVNPWGESGDAESLEEVPDSNDQSDDE